MLKTNRFCAFILTHGRPDRVITIKSLLRAGYTGDWYLVCDDEDPTLDEYKRIHGRDKVLVFSKDAVAERFDECDAGGSRGVIFYARNAAFDFAAEMGYEAFVELDDDYSGFYWRVPRRGTDNARVENFDCLCEMMVDWLKSSSRIAITALAQGGDYIGGCREKKMLRKAMNVLFCLTDRRVPFIGRINEDVSTYCTLGMRGRVFATTMCAQVNQMTTQKNKGGMTDTYLEQGTYSKSMYTVIQCPSFVSVRMMGDSHKRLHHHIDRLHGMPMILRAES